MKGFLKRIMSILLLIAGIFIIGSGASFAEEIQDNTSTEKVQADINTKTAQTGDTVLGINLNPSCLTNGQCSFNIYQLLGIKKTVVDASNPEIFVQDILLSATFFIGTVVTLALIVSGIMFIMASASGKSPDKAKVGIKNSLIGLLIVVSSYSIIRIVQYIAKGV